MATTGIEAPLNFPGPTERDRGTLLGAMESIQDDWFDSPRHAAAWEQGITWLPWGTGNVSTDASDCATSYAKDPRDLPEVAIQPAFLIYDSLQCSTLGPGQAFLAERVYRNLEVYASAAFAAELETAAQSGGVGLVGDVDHAPAVASAGARSLAQAIHDLEEHLADVLHGGKGVIHLTPGLLALAGGLVEFRDGQYRTKTGHVVVGGAGHTGTAAPYGQSAAGTGTAWVYATGPVYGRVGEHHGISGPTTTGEDQVYISRNKDRPLDERYGVLAFDPDTIGAALVDIAASDDSEDSGDGVASADLSNVDDNATNVTLVDANPNRAGLLVFNDSDQALYLKYGANATTTSFTVKIAAGGYWEMPSPIFTGQIDGVWEAGSTGAARITEL